MKNIFTFFLIFIIGSIAFNQAICQEPPNEKNLNFYYTEANSDRSTTKDDTESKTAWSALNLIQREDFNKEANRKVKAVKKYLTHALDFELSLELRKRAVSLALEYFVNDNVTIQDSTIFQHKNDSHTYSIKEFFTKVLEHNAIGEQVIFEGIESFSEFDEDTGVKQIEFTQKILYKSVLNAGIIRSDEKTEKTVDRQYFL